MKNNKPYRPKRGGLHKNVMPVFIFAILAVSIVFGQLFKIYLAFTADLNSLPLRDSVNIYTPKVLVLDLPESPVLGLGTFDAFEVIDAVNEKRRDAGSPPLRANETLMKAASLRAETIIENENFSHQDPYDEVELSTVLPRLGYRFSYASENIGMGGNSGKEFVEGFMNSTAHRENLLDPQLTDTGVGVADGPYGRYYVNVVVQIFTVPGGDTEYLGYDKSDTSFYETQLTAIATKLEPLTWFFLRIGNPPLYNDEYRQTLMRQKEILETVVAVMRRAEPLTNSHVALIREYNSRIMNRQEP